MLHQLAGRDASNVDPSVLEQVKEQIFTGLFADYASKGKQQFRTKLDLFKTCVPYYVIAERQFAENEQLRLRVREFEKANEDAPKAKSFSVAFTQTSTEELNKTSGVDALRENIDQLQAIITDLQAEKFRVHLTAEETVNSATAENQNLKDQLQHIKAQSDAVMAEAEILRKEISEIKERNSQLETRNETIWQRASGLLHPLRCKASVELRNSDVL
jgi:prefoldin subunit 5